jgi:hypothetical protein
MAFQKKVWTARQGTGLNKFSVDGGAPVTLVNQPDSITIPGDAFSQENMNDLEGRIAAAFGTVYGVKIDRTNSNPATAVTYTDDAVGFTPSSGNNGAFMDNGWSDKFPFNQIKPCLLLNGVVQGYLNPNNFSQWADGHNPAPDITSGAGGDVMIEVPKVYYKISQDSQYTYVKICENALSKITDGFTDFAHSYKGVVKDKFYVGAYLGFVDDNNKLRSISGRAVTGNKAIGAFRTAAQANGTGYDQLSFNKLTLLQILYLMRFKSLNSQTALGYGNASGGVYTNTGLSDANGMNYGVTATNAPVKCNGMEDFWGNKYQWVDGFYLSATGDIMIADGEFNDTGAGYTKYGNQPSTIIGYTKYVRGTNEMAFIPSDLTGSNSTYYSDYGYLYVAPGGRLPYFGGFSGDGAIAGAFCLYVDSAASDPFVGLGARLLFNG